MKKKVTLKDYRMFMKDQGLYYNSSDYSDDYDIDSQSNGWSLKHGQYTL